MIETCVCMPFCTDILTNSDSAKEDIYIVTTSHIYNPINVFTQPSY